MAEKKIQPVEPDAQLLLNAKNGDHTAFTEIVRRYEQMVYNFAFKVCRNREKADETMQDTFINVYRKLKQFDGKSKISTWLYTIVTNNCLMKQRRRKLDIAIVPFEEPPELYDSRRHTAERFSSATLPAWKESPLHKIMDKELRTVLDEAIIKLPIDHRIVFVLRDVEGQSAEETAKILKLSVPSVKSRLRRARIFLREQLNEYMTS
jgi:RNA polymerase sigma-70 factor (ECF subfamily)